MSEIKPIDWDSLPKVWAWDSDPNHAKEVVLFRIEKSGSMPFYCFFNKDFAVNQWMFISETDPRIKTPKMRVMTAEELNDIYWEFGKDFRFKTCERTYFTPIDKPIGIIDEDDEYSTDRGRTWNKCEVPE